MATQVDKTRPREVKRKLTAILSADVKGYSRLMGEDEEATVRTLNVYKEVMASVVQQYRGRVVDAPGDNVLAEFASVVDAVRCAVEIQKTLKPRNAELPENRRMEFRIGVNLGDVIEDGEQILGDGVNIAARLESLSEAGGICISGTAFDQVKNKLNLGYKYLGEQAVKNILEPVRVYQVLIEPETAGKVIGEKRTKPRQWQMTALVVVGVLIVVAAGFVIWRLYLHPAPPLEVASREKMAFQSPDKPSIAVLPFVNMSDDPKQEYFCNGLTDTIITSLSRIPHLSIAARYSTFTYKGKSVKVQQVAEDLNVRYVLEGSVQKSEKRIRVRAQLIDAINSRHLWAESYDRDLKGIFAVQDEITSKVVTSLHVVLTSGESASAAGKSTKSLEALELYWRASYHRERIKKEDNALARQYAEKAIEIDPGYSSAWAVLGLVHSFDARFGWSSSREQSAKLAEGCGQKALSLDPSEPKAIQLLCHISISKRDYDNAIRYAEMAVETSPNDPWAYWYLANSYRFVGRFEEAIASARKAMRLTPHYPAYILGAFGYSSFHLRRYDDALWAGKKFLERSQRGEAADWNSSLLLAVTYSELGQYDEARKHAAEILKADPNWNFEVMKRIFVYKNQSDLDRLLNAGLKVGLK